ncbi:hypothetical protein [Herbiconiux flava]|uniref:Uncharacterized protein n=1 Tax=Herbiconiux flava TaxID=881268 RepID=A0A852SQB4_9MICO|nr:hypothetical protein [Herbiconiux flava]NYD70975.1 hypothetical protein [Herbiconiux flava]
MARSTRGDAVRIGGNPGLGSWKLVLVVTAVCGGVLSAFPGAAYVALGLGEWSWVLGFLTAWAIIAGALLLGLHLAYGGLVWYPSERAVELRGRRVPVDTITEAWRSLSSNGTATYVVYRFVSTEGPSVRLLVAGRPMKGLDAAGVKALARFVRELPLVVPDARPDVLGDTDAPRLTDRQRAAAVSLTTGGGKSRVGRETLLTELGADEPTDGDHLEPAAPADDEPAYLPPASTRRHRPAGDRVVISAREAARLEREWEADDQHAERMLAADPGRAQTFRRLFFWLTVGSLTVAVIAIVLAIVGEDSSDGLLGSLDDDLVVALIIGPGLLGLLFYIGLCAASDAQLRHVRRLGRRWLDERSRDDPEVQTRGLAASLLAAWVGSALRLRSVLAFLLCLLGSFIVVASVFFFTENSPLGGALCLAIGVALVVVAVLLFLRVQRRKRADAEQLVLLGGWRVLPPEIER